MEEKSIYETVIALRNQRSSRSELKSADLASFPFNKLKYLPLEYNGNVVFELPRSSIVKGGGAAMLDGMDRQHDGHAWIETTTTNLSDPDGQLSFKYVKCLSHLRSGKLFCPHLERIRDYNEKYWEGSTPEVLVPGSIMEVPQKCTLVCDFCKVTPCLKLCSCKMFYITPKDLLMFRACVHIGTHDHPIANGDCREAMDIIRAAMKNQIAKTPIAKSSAIGLAVGR